MSAITRICKICNKEKILNDFPKRKNNVRLKTCKRCYQLSRATYNKEYRWKTRRFVYDYLLTHPCVDCSEKDPIVLEFDHITNNKSYDISKMINNRWSPQKVLEEINKCQVRCANCHRKKTAKTFAWFKDLISKI